jgi:hypothetical protein
MLARWHTRTRIGAAFPSTAYTGIAVCAPSRNSFMSGLRPDVTGIFNFYNHIREPGQPPIVTTPQQFKNAGWVVLGGGKTFHYNVPPYFDDVSYCIPLQVMNGDCCLSCCCVLDWKYASKERRK